MAATCEGGPHYFSKPWKLSDVILLVEEEKFHVHRAVLALSSPVFEKMFSSEFQEKDKNEVTLPDKKASEVEELLLMLYPSVAEKQITEENCFFLVNLAHEYQIETIVRRCEDFMVENVKTKAKDCIIAELIFARKYELVRLKRATIEQACNLSLEELKNDKMYDPIKDDDLMDIMEGIMLRQGKELQEFKHQVQRNKGKILAINEQSNTALKQLEMIARQLVIHAGLWNRDLNNSDHLVSCLLVLSMDEGSDYCKTCDSARCCSLREVSKKLSSIKHSLESIIKNVQPDKETLLMP